MPIVNSVYKGKKLFVSEFFCPHCFMMRAYDIKPMSKEIVFCQIPFLAENEPGHVIECQACKNAFDPEILSRHIQSLFRLAGTAKYQLQRGTSPGFLKRQLMSDGLQENFAEHVVTFAQH